MKFSKRGEALIGQEMFNILEQARKLEVEGKYIYHLELGEPKNNKGTKNYPPGRVINRTIASLLNNDVGYTSPAGLWELRQELSEYLIKKHQKQILIGNIAISPTNMLIYQLLDIVCERNNYVGIFTPAFPSYIASINYIGLQTWKVPLCFADGFNMTCNDVDAMFTIRPKVVFVNSGNNPTGAVYNQSVLKYLVDKAKLADCWIISDETYGMLSYGSRKYYSMLNFDYEKLIVISSFSKVFNVPGYRVGYAVADPMVIDKITLSSSTMYTSLPIFTQEGIYGGISIMDEFAEEKKQYYKQLSKECVEIVNKSKYIRCNIPESAFYLFIDIRKLNIDSKTFCMRLLNKHNTATTPGSCFGYEGFIRVAFCGNIDDVKAGLNQIVVFAEELGNDKGI